MWKENSDQTNKIPGSKSPNGQSCAWESVHVQVEVLVESPAVSWP